MVSSSNLFYDFILAASGWRPYKLSFFISPKRCDCLAGLGEHPEC